MNSKFEEQIVNCTGISFIDEIAIGTLTVNRLRSLTEQEARDLLENIFGYAQATQYCALFSEDLKEGLTFADVYKECIDGICKLVNVTQTRDKGAV